jgi:hypothetical protein
MSMRMIVLPCRLRKLLIGPSSARVSGFGDTGIQTNPLSRKFNWLMLRKRGLKSAVFRAVFTVRLLVSLRDSGNRESTSPWQLHAGNRSLLIVAHRLFLKSVSISGRCARSQGWAIR